MVEAVASAGGGCNQWWWRLQPYVGEVGQPPHAPVPAPSSTTRLPASLAPSQCSGSRSASISTHEPSHTTMPAPPQQQACGVACSCVVASGHVVACSCVVLCVVASGHVVAAGLCSLLAYTHGTVRSCAAQAWRHSKHVLRLLDACAGGDRVVIVKEVGILAAVLRLEILAPHADLVAVDQR